LNRIRTVALAAAACLVAQVTPLRAQQPAPVQPPATLSAQPPASMPAQPPLYAPLSTQAPALAPGGGELSPQALDDLLKSYGFQIKVEDGQRVVEVTLKQVLQLAVERNLTLQSVRFGETVAESGVRAAEGRFSPTLTNTANYQRYMVPSFSSGLPDYAVFGGTESWTLASTFSKPTDTGISYSLTLSQLNETPFSVIVPSEGASPGAQNKQGNINVDQLTGALTIPMGQNSGRDYNAIQLHRAEAGLTGSRLTTSQNMLSLVQSTASTYWDLVSAIENRRVQEDAVKLSQQLLQDNEQRLKAGVLSPFDVQVTQTQLARDQQGLVAAKAEVLRIEDLARALLDVPVTDFTLRPLDRPQVQDVDMNYPELLKRVYANSPDVKQIENQLRLNSLDLEEALNSDRVNLNLNLFYTAQGVSGSAFGGVSGFGQTALGNYGATLTWTVPLFNVQIPETIRQRTLQRQQLQLQLASKTSDLNVSLQSVLRQLRVAREQVDTAVVARHLAEDQLKNEIERFRVGESTSFQVAQSQQDALNAQVQEILARLAFERDYLALLALTGDIYGQFGLTPPSQ
jgi:outer membrane protein